MKIYSPNPTMNINDFLISQAIHRENYLYYLPLHIHICENEDIIVDGKKGKPHHLAKYLKCYLPVALLV